MKFHSYVFVCLFCLVLTKKNKQPKVTVENGVLVGRYETSHSGQLYQSFLGVPYAKPPVGDNRFKEAERLDKKWPGEYNATIAGSPCLQYDHFTMKSTGEDSYEYQVIGDEDCLFLNIFTKNTGATNKSVFVYIHGGAFMFGFSTQYSPRYIMDHDDIIFVTINYRVGPLGFLTTGDGIVPGNNGLKDQVVALEWIQRNIAAFGGDPTKVSLTGCSAGGASVHYHYLSPLSEGLFNNGYSYSGSVLSPWAFVSDGVEKTNKLAQLMGCPTLDSKAMVKCLKRRPARQIVERVKEFQPWLYNPYTVFGPVAEVGSLRPFIDQHPRDLLQEGKARNLPWITGFTSAEGLYPVSEFMSNEKQMSYLNKHWDELAWSLLFYNQQEFPLSAQKIKQEYLQNKDISTKTGAQIVQMVGDRAFVVSGIEAVKLQAQHNTELVYLYRFDYRGRTSVSRYFAQNDEDYGVSHGDDMFYVIGMPDAETAETPNDIKMGNLLSGLYLEFGYTGHVPAYFNWTPVSNNPADQLNYLEVSSPTKFAMKNNEDVGHYNFWTTLMENPIDKDEL